MTKDMNSDFPMVPPIDGEGALSGRLPGPDGPPHRPPFDGPEDILGMPAGGEAPAPHDMPAPAPPPSISSWKRFSRVFFGRKVVVFSLVVIVLLILMAIFAPFIAPYKPNDIFVNGASRLEQPSAAHWLGTDKAGRDILSRVIYGARVSLQIALYVVIIASVIGMFLGLVAGYYRWARTVIMRVMDALMAFPMILLTMTIAALLGGGMKNVIVALVIGMVPSYARIMCGMVLQGKENDYVLALRSVGSSNSRILYKHIFMNCLQPFIVLMTMQLGGVVLAEAGLSFLGVGIPAQTAAWGSMINDGREVLTTNPLLSLAPGLVLMIMVFSFNMLGDGLRDALDPRLRGMI